VPVFRAGLRASAGPLPDGPLVSFGLAGALSPDLAAGDLVSARLIVDAAGRTLWAGEPVAVTGARTAVLLAADRVVDDPAERAELARRTGADAVDMESGALAATGRLAGAVKAIADTPARRVGPLALAARPDGSVAWRTVLRAFATQPRTAARAAMDARRALSALEPAARELAG
jgi:adenosylhomocysteine nucleosidase